ncbi:hypothetical protein [Celeribacter arenosi]|uniref:Sulfotransferase family protein n=1 Tax=Celeribacter arenosi TaxID=792649 RepID=A0ABP7K8L6_9RHOB
MKVLVLGTSHVGAFLLARDEIRADFPDIEVSYFGLPGDVFSRAVAHNGIFRTENADDRLFEWNEAREIDLRPFDQILLTGTRFMWLLVMRLFATRDVLDEPQRRGLALISRPALTAFIDAAVEDAVAGLFNRIPPDPRITVLPAPYPLVRSWKPGFGHEPIVTAASQMDTIGVWTGLYEDAILTHLAAQGMGFIAQPQDTRADPIRSQNRFARANSSAEEVGNRVDNRHLNADYGRHAFSHYAQSTLGLTPAAAQKDLDGAP